MSSLTGTKIKDTYDGLLKTTDNGALGASAKQITDGLGNSSGVYLGTSGNVGIGATPTYQFEVGGVSQPRMAIVSTSATGASQLNFGDNSDGDVGRLRYDHNGDFMAIYTSGSEKMRIDSSGNVGIGGSANANSKLHLYTSSGDIQLRMTSDSSSKNIIQFGDTTDETAGAIIYDNPTNALIFENLNSVERMRIDSSGRVGINGNPDAKLKVFGDSAYTVTSSGRAAEGIDILATAGGSGLYGGAISFGTGGSGRSAIAAVQGSADSDVNGLAFFTHGSGTGSADASERMRITSGGDVLIGTQGIPDGTTYYGSAFQGASQGRMTLQMAVSSTSSYGLVNFKNPNGIVGSIVTSGSATSYNTSSDYRLKENVVPMTGALDRVAQLKPSRFNFIADPETTVDGFLAHEVQEVIPEAATGVKDGMREEEYEVEPAVYEEVVHPAEEAVYETIEHPAIAEELDADGNIIVEAQEAYTEEVLVSEAKEEWTEQVLVSEAVMGTRSVPDYQGIDQSKIVPLLTGALQEANALIKDLEARVAALEV